MRTTSQHTLNDLGKRYLEGFSFGCNSHLTFLDALFPSDEEDSDFHVTIPPYTNQHDNIRITKKIIITKN